MDHHAAHSCTKGREVHSSLKFLWILLSEMPCLTTRSPYQWAIAGYLRQVSVWSSIYGASETKSLEAGQWLVARSVCRWTGEYVVAE